jgi:hypothetical protein
MDDDQREMAERTSWGEYRRLILAELERISKDIRELNAKMEAFRQQDVAQMKTDIALLKFQAALYGAISGIVTTGIISFAIKFIHV